MGLEAVWGSTQQFDTHIDDKVNKAVHMNGADESKFFLVLLHLFMLPYST
jgi:hypothetical protein